jgi:hypothetical protein
MEIKKKRVNDTAIVVINGKIYTRTCVTDAGWIQIMEAAEDVSQAQNMTEFDVAMADLISLIDPIRAQARMEAEMAKRAAMDSLELEQDIEVRMRKAKRIADISGLFEYDEDGITYMKGFRHPMPKLLVEALLDAHYNPASEYTVSSLVNFWKYLLLNPDKHVREGLFSWIKTGQFALTEDGNIISYRNVDVKRASQSKALQDFISESWTKLRGQKKSPKNYFVYDNNGVYSYSTDNCKDGVCLGVVADLFADAGTVEDETIYTDNYTGKMEIRMGEPISMIRKDCSNDPNDSCSAGLHCKSARYSLNLGSDVIVTLVNPFHVVAIPSYDSTKFRTCQYLPVSKAEITKGKLVEFKPGTYDIPYNGFEEILDILNRVSFEELQRNGDISEELTKEDFGFVLQKATEVIAKRIIKMA